MQASLFQLFPSYVFLQLLEVGREELDVFLVQDQTCKDGVRSMVSIAAVYTGVIFRRSHIEFLFCTLFRNIISPFCCAWSNRLAAAL